MISTSNFSKGIRFTDSVSVRIGPERGFLFDQRSGRIYSLNASGAFAASKIHNGETVDDVISAITEEFDVDTGTVLQDFAHFATLLIDNGLACPNE